MLDEQEIHPGFAAYKVGKAILILGRYGKGAGYTDKAFEFKPREVQEALELVSGAKGPENMQCFNLVVTQTSKRLAGYVFRFALSLQRRVQGD